MNHSTAALSFLVGLFAALLITPLVIRLAPKFGLVDKPNARKVHAKIMPRAGGIGIFLSFIASFFAALFLSGGASSIAPQTWHIIGGASAIFMLGLADDILDLSPRWKFLGQFVVAGWMVAVGLRIHTLGVPFLDHTPILAAVTFIWIVGVSNAVNLIDGMDGLAAGISLMVMLTMTVIGFQNGADSLMLVLPLAGATLGFLRYNFNPAKIFMGDCGSLFLGFSLAVISVINTSVIATTSGFLIAIVALGLPLFDTLFSMARRLLVGRKPFSPDKEHTHHKILAKGFTHRQAVLIMYSLTAMLCLVSFCIVIADSRLLGALLMAYPFVAYLMIRRLDWIPRIVWIQQRRLRIGRERRYRRGYASETVSSRLIEKLLHSKPLVWALECAVIAISWVTAMWLTFPNSLQTSWFTVGEGTLAQFAIWALLALHFQPHQDIWKYIEFNVIGRHLKPMILSAILSAPVAEIGFGLEFDSRFWIALVLISSVGIILVRLAPNFYYSFIKRQSAQFKHGPRILIFGAGDSGALCHHLVTHHDTMQFQVVGFIDDDPLKKGKTIRDARVLGGLDELAEIRKRTEFDILVFSTVPRTKTRRQELASTLLSFGIVAARFEPKLGRVQLTRFDLSSSKLFSTWPSNKWDNSSTLDLENYDSQLDSN